MKILMANTYATAYFQKKTFSRCTIRVAGVEDEKRHAIDNDVNLYSHRTHDHTSVGIEDGNSYAFRSNRNHFGASTSLQTIKLLAVTLSFHQFFEGMGFESCINQARFKKLSVIIMGLFFSLITLIKVTIGIRIFNVYDDNSPTTLIVEGVLNVASIGILIYMALVFLLLIL
ncbi:hypothetical protein Ahy_A06g030138 [Arachis hypogaea]|uniref:Uncharacterized protein n=1 Tax=Arachis hypogaea TaxID=3818 RepID=A0A445CVE1_ARAHY|nr:hypothetical protein Ahy_A06g030138 [Arachis hypogaea]